MLKVTTYEVHETSDGQKFTALSVAQEVQARLNLAAAFGSEEWENTIGRINPNHLLAFIEQNREVILDFLSPCDGESEIGKG